MPLRAGTSTPWAEWTGDVEDPAYALYVREGWVPGAVDYLAEQLRMDGFAHNLGDAFRRAEEATLSLHWYGWDPLTREPAFCDEHGYTASGHEVENLNSCTVAVLINVA